MDTVAIIPAAGYGRRMGSSQPKPYLDLGDRPVIAWTLQVFEEHPYISGVYLVVAPEWVEYVQATVVGAYSFRKVVKVVPGGKQRQDSVYNALEVLPPNTGLVVVHDGVRPFLHPGILKQAIEAAENKGGACVALPLTDTIKKVSEAGLIEKTLVRESLWAAQTPQVFPYPLLWEAYRRAARESFLGTDDASLVERLGYPVKIIPGSPYNLKITTPEDLRLAEVILKHRLGARD